MPERTILTQEQLEIQSEFVQLYGLEPEQISFEGNEPNPILDYEAISLLSLQLTDIQELDCWISERGKETGTVTVRCVVTLPDGRKRSAESSAALGEPLPGGKTIDTFQLAEAVARARASRVGIRSVGVNLFNAHKKFKESGNIATGHLRFDPRKPLYDEIHVNAEKAGYIVGKDKSEYQKFIAESYEGRTSAKDLDDAELNRLNITFRSFARLKVAAQTQTA